MSRPGQEELSLSLSSTSLQWSMRPFGILIWPMTVIDLLKLQRRSVRFVKGDITGQHPVYPRCCMILAGVTLKTVGGTLALLYKIVTGRACGH